MSNEKGGMCDGSHRFGALAFMLSLLGSWVSVSEAAVREVVSLPVLSQSSSLNVRGKNSSNFFFFDDRSNFGIPVDEGSSFSISRALVTWDLRKVPEDATFVGATVTVGGNRVTSETSSVAPKTLGFYLFDGDYASFMAASDELKFGELGLNSTLLGSANVKPSTVPSFSKEIQFTSSQLSREVFGVVFRSDETNDPDQDDRHTYSTTLPTLEVTYDVPERLKVTGVRQVGHEGGQHTFQVISNVDWQLSESTPWLSSEVESGSEDFTGEVVLEENPTENPRTATLTFTGGGLSTTFSITQAGNPLVLEIDDSSESFDWRGDSHFFEVTSDSVWSFSTSENWITTSEMVTQSGNQQFSYLVTENSLETPRSGTITFTSASVSRTHTVTQGGFQPYIFLSHYLKGFESTGGVNAFLVDASVPWSYTTSADWITTEEATNQSGVKTFTYAVEPNPTETSRTGTITFTNGPSGLSETHTITQEAAVFFMYISHGLKSFGDTGGENTFLVEANVPWSYTTSADWITTEEATNQSGEQYFSYAVEPNPTESDRTGTITFANGSNGETETHTVTQDGTLFFMYLSHGLKSFEDTGGENTFLVEANVPWSYTTSADWITTEEATNQSGEQYFSYAVEPNPTESDRTGKITFTNGSNGETESHSVTQEAAVLFMYLSHYSKGFESTGGENAFLVEANVPWSYTTSVNWITTEESISQSGEQEFTYGVEPNPFASSRTGTITFTNGPNGETETHTITQTGIGSLLTFDDFIGGFPEIPIDQRGKFDDPDADGVVNVMELFHRSSPVDRLEDGGVDVYPSGGVLKMRFHVGKTVPSEVSEVKWSSDLNSWQASGQLAGGVSVNLAQVVVDDSHPDYDVVEVTATVSAGNPENLYIRLGVEEAAF